MASNKPEVTLGILFVSKLMDGHKESMIISILRELMHHDFDNFLESLHLLLNSTSHSSTGKAYRVPNIDRTLCFPGEQFSKASCELY